ncbi:peptidoglycan DD-metalloendopeptidase family protein [Litorilituus sediminis]|nr:peptidoglycan DD-metalloendopeptidase family protein [Litorilituus sediminis]
MNNFSFLLVALIYLLCSNITTVQGSTVYKYKDENGNWVFSDKPPEQEVETQELTFKHQVNIDIKPSVYVAKNQSYYAIVVKNPFHAPIEIELLGDSIPNNERHHVVKAQATTVVVPKLTHHPAFSYRWLQGDPKAKHDDSLYKFPSSSGREFLITQSFNGRFSHSKQPNQYAVDIAMPVGTSINAARAGIVVGVKDDYHMSGKSQYFLDKANYVQVLHNDGTFAVYAHLLQDTAVVNVGDRVSVGDKLGRSGSSGYSTGPHLHFVIRKNAGFKFTSVPFAFLGQDEQAVTPKRGMVFGKQG